MDTTHSAEPIEVTDGMQIAFARLQSKVSPLWGLVSGQLPYFFLPSGSGSASDVVVRNDWLAKRWEVLIDCASGDLLRELVRLVLRPGSEPNSQPLQDVLLALFGYQEGEDALENFKKEGARLVQEAERLLSAAPEPTDRQVGGRHYADMPIQPVAFILANGLGFCEGNVVKYVCRYQNKNGVEDLKKARHYLDLLIAETEKSG